MAAMLGAVPVTGFVRLGRGRSGAGGPLSSRGRPGGPSTTYTGNKDGRRFLITSPRRSVAICSAAASPPPGTEEEEDEAAKSDNYTDAMQQRMGGSLKYVHEDGINYAYVLPDLIVGSCPQNADDVDRLAEMGVGAIFCLQEDHDARYFGFEVSDIQTRCEERGDIAHVRCPVRDFDPFSLRLKLPNAVATLHAAKLACPDKAVYVHCTAGLGRAPGTALAYMYWMRGYQLMEAHKILMDVRPCHPKLDAIRAATCDILFDASRMPCRISVYRSGTCQKIQVSGLDVGWGEMLDFEYDPKRRAFILERDLLPGFYPYKFIWDGHWGYSGVYMCPHPTHTADHPTYHDGEHTNNFMKVPTSGGSDEEQARSRLTSPESQLKPDERARIESSLSE